MSTYTICKFKTAADYETAVNWFKNTEALDYDSPGEVGYNDEEFEIGTMDYYAIESELAPLVSYMELWFDADEWGTDESKATFVDGKMVSVEQFERHPIFGY